MKPTQTIRREKKMLDVRSTHCGQGGFVLVFSLQREEENAN
jgi:hypothetical protein